MPGGYGRRSEGFGAQRGAKYLEGVKNIDYKDHELLRRFMTERGKIKPRSQTGTNAKFQRMLNTAIKRARYMALISPTKL